MSYSEQFSRIISKISVLLLVELVLGSLQNKFSVKVGNLAQGGGRGSDPIPTFFQN